MIVAEASGEMEARDQLPLRPYAPAGSLLERTFKRMGYSRQQFSLTNTLRCRPRNNWLSGAPWEWSALNHCRPNLDAAIRDRRLRAILALGDTATRELTGEAGEARGVSHLCGYVLRGPSDTPVVPAFHPAFIRRGAARLQGIFARNLQRVVNVAAGKDREWIWGIDPERSETYANLRYQMHPSLDEAASFVIRVRASAGSCLSYDIETYESASLDEDARDGFTDTNIRLVQFSLTSGEGIALPWEGRYRELARDLLRTDNIKCGHNLWLFDNKVLAAVGARESLDLKPRGPIHDTLQMFHHWQPDLPAHLQFCAQFVQFPFPWKHLAATNLEFYGCLTGESRVMLWDGTSRKIEDIVRNKEDVIVRTMDKNGYSEIARVVGWKRIRVPGQAWLKIKTEGTDQPLYLTPDHEVWCNDRWMTAAELHPGWIVRSSKYGESDLIHGTLLGDSHCDPRGRLSFTHSAKQREWFEIKRVALEGPNHAPIKIKPRKIGKYVVGNGIHYRTEVAVSKTLWRKRFYNEFGKKLFVPPSDPALAVWYCDDGCWAVSADSKRHGWLGNPRIIAQGFANLDFLIEWFRLKFGRANVSYYPDKRVKQGGAVSLIGEARHAFFAAVAPYIPIPMQYKLPPQYRGRYAGWLSQPKPQETVIEDICDYDPGPRNRDYRYCITVNHPEHRFFAMGGLVKNCVDVDATLRLYTFLRTQLERDGIWDSADGVGGYVGQVAEVRPILADMERRGLPVDDVERLKLDGEFKLASEELANELMPRFPESAKKLDPYKTFPPELKKLPESDWGQLFREPDKIDKKTEKVKAGKWYRYGQREIEGVLRWCYIPEFNPNSGKQLIEYMKARGYKVPKSKETDDEGNQKDTTNKKELVRLAHRTGDNFFLKTIEYRELSKMRGTYIDGFAPHADGCVHTTFTFDTGIGQLSSRNPNIQNFPKHGRLAKAVRRMIAAKPGYILTDWDYKSCHVLTLGFLAEDANYIRCARIDMHSIVTGHKLGLWHAIDLLRDYSDADIKAKCKWLKSNPEWKHIRDARMKHAILGIGNGLKAKGLFEKHMEDFSSQKEAQQFLDVVEELFPKVFEFHGKVQQLAHTQTYLKTQYGHIRRFYEVFRWDYKKAAYSHGDQAEEAISYWLSNIAFGYIREHMKLLDAAGLCEKYGMFDNVHDALSFRFPAEMLEEHIADVYPILITPSKVLAHPTICPEGLWIDAECNAGANWAEMEEVRCSIAQPATV